jgi:hypothetical protein
VKLFAAARLLLRLLRDLKTERQLIAKELAHLNRTLDQLLLVHARQANYLPPPPADVPVTVTTKIPNWALGKSDAQVFVEVETVRTRLLEQLGREPFEEELFRALEGELGRRESRV